MSAYSVDELLAPLGDAAPCGSDLAYDPAFLALETAARGKPEQEFGNTLIKAEEPDWRAVAEQALELARRSRDLRIAVLLARASARVDGVAAYARGVALIAGLIERLWQHLHPALDADDGGDPTMRLNAVAPLAAAEAGLADLRRAKVGRGPAALDVRALELAWSRTEPLPGEVPPTRDGSLRALRDAEAAEPGTLQALAQVHADVRRIETMLAQQVGATTGPDLRPLLATTAALASAALAASGRASADDELPVPGLINGPLTASGAIHSRADVNRVLDSVCEWIERNEPTNPAPLLIRRAQRLMNKSFLDIIRDLAPDGVSQVERIAGAAAE